LNIAKRTLDGYGGVDSCTFLASTFGTDEPGPPITLDPSLFTANVHYPKLWIPNGTPLAKHTGTGFYGPYANLTSEQQTVTEGGSGLTSFTLTYSGQTTGSIAAAATAATVQAALEALSNIAPGDVVVTGSAGGPYTVTFGGTLAATNVAQMTATPTGGTGTVTIATSTAGGAESVSALTTGAGLLWGAVKVDAGATRLGGAMLRRGLIHADKLPFPVDAGFWTDVAASGLIKYAA
jgi:hypothetical protein